MIAVGLVLEGCGGGLDVTVRPKTGLKRTSSVTVESGNFDSANLKFKIEKALFKNGVDVESPSFAGTNAGTESASTAQLSNPSSQTISDSATSHSATGNGQSKKFVYLLKFTYDFDYTFSGEVITDFSAAVVEPETGEVVGIMGYHDKGGGATADELADIVGKKLSQQLK